MNTRKHRFLLSERTTLEELIAQAPSDSIITRLSLERRLKQVQENLKAYEGLSSKVVKARLTFRGKPVLGSRGVSADFAGEAVNHFADAVVHVGAGSYTPLSQRGKVPNSEDYGLVITGTARGSFGFEIEDAAQTPPLAGESTPAEAAMRQVMRIMKASTGTDEQLADAIGITDPRALRALQTFLKTVADNDAICALELNDDVFTFRDSAQIQRSVDRLGQDNITEDEIRVSGHFQGFLPKGRRAEFVVKESDAEFLRDSVGEVISVRVATSVTEDVQINEILDQPINVEAHTRRVGNSAPRYTITNCVLS